MLAIFFIKNFESFKFSTKNDIHFEKTYRDKEEPEVKMLYQATPRAIPARCEGMKI